MNDHVRLLAAGIFQRLLQANVDVVREAGLDRFLPAFFAIVPSLPSRGLEFVSQPGLSVSEIGE